MTAIKYLPHILTSGESMVNILFYNQMIFLRASRHKAVVRLAQFWVWFLAIFVRPWKDKTERTKHARHCACGWPPPQQMYKATIFGGIKLMQNSGKSCYPKEIKHLHLLDRWHDMDAGWMETHFCPWCRVNFSFPALRQ